MLKPLIGHDSEEIAHVQVDYPYGFKLRCQRRCWLERDEKRGYRFVTQTSNPKKSFLTWNAPKKSTYSLLGVMGLDEKEHVTWTGLSAYSSLEEIKEFGRLYGESFDAEQRKTYDTWLRIKEVQDRKASL